MSAKVIKTDLGGNPSKYNDGVELSNARRWSKHGNDRIYPNSAKEGYVDLNAGEVVEMTPHYSSGVDEYRMDFNADKDALELIEIPRLEIAQKKDVDERVVATIPTEAF